MRKISVAPMLDCTDRHFRRLMRIISKNTYLYTEMITTGAILFGDRPRHLNFDNAELPLALQLGGSDPKALSDTAIIAEAWGYTEVNLNVGCPSDRVQSGRFGACLMKEPLLVKDCISAMAESVHIPVTVKTRLGVDEVDTYEHLYQFIDTVRQAPCHTFILHARKAWLKGLSPKENRNIPPLQYDRVHQIKKDFPELEIIINGGINTIEAIENQLEQVDGVMIGREAYANPYLFATFDQRFFDDPEPIKTRREIVNEYLPYLIEQIEQGVPLRHLTRHLVGLFRGVPGARVWRRFLTEQPDKTSGPAVVEEALKLLESV